jgi:hypothetical protein
MPLMIGRKLRRIIALHPRGARVGIGRHKVVAGAGLPLLNEAGTRAPGWAQRSKAGTNPYASRGFTILAQIPAVILAGCGKSFSSCKGASAWGIACSRVKRLRHSW